MRIRELQADFLRRIRKVLGPEACYAEFQSTHVGNKMVMGEHLCFSVPVAHNPKPARTQMLAIGRLTHRHYCKVKRVHTTVRSISGCGARYWDFNVSILPPKED